jgi:hypothetical protein
MYDKKLVSEALKQIQKAADLLSLSEGLIHPSCSLTVLGLHGAKLWISAHPLMLNSAESKLP